MELAVFDDLLVTGPNGGGLFAVRQGEVTHVDGLSATGLCLKGGNLVRAFQPGDWAVYGETEAVGVMTSVAAGLHCADIHDVLWVDDGFLMVSTDHNEVVQVDAQWNMGRRWAFPGELDSMHINCLALWGGKVVYSAFGLFHERRAYKAASLGAGIVQALDETEPVITGLSQPHSLTPWGNDLLVADSQAHAIALYDPRGKEVRRKVLGGYTRGVCVGRDALYVGLSRSRLDSPDHRSGATLLALDLNSWEVMASLPIASREIYDVRQLEPGVSMDGLIERIRSVRINPYIYES